MSRLQSICPIPDCGHAAQVLQSFPLQDEGSLWSQVPSVSKLERYKCGHLFYQSANVSLATSPTRSYKSLDGTKETRHYQVEGLDFIKASGFNCLVADQQGLGKTIEALLAIREFQTECTPTLIVVKSATIWQWQREIKEWFSAVPSAVWMIRDGKGFIPPGFQIYLISMDTLRSYVKPTGQAPSKAKKPINPYAAYASSSKQEFAVHSAFLALGIKFLIADEIHSFKNTDSRRSQALVEFIRICGIQRKVFLSGTPIKNRASEYFIPLNLLDPIHFPSVEQFKNRYLDGERISSHALDAFKSQTAGYIIRRERNQVLQDLPKFTRVFEDVEIESETLKKLYNIELEKLREKDADKASGLTYNDIKSNLMTMRRIIGQAKAELIVPTIEEFLESTEDEKIVIGVHHHMVRDYLIVKLAAHRPLALSGEDSTDRKQRLIDEFQKPHRRVMIVNILAGGTGLNLQFCNNCVVLERQWNAADEEQFEDRFNRIGQKLPVTAAYPKALKTIDEWFSNMVEQKRAIFGETVALDFENWMDAGSVADLVNWATSQQL